MIIDHIRNKNTYHGLGAGITVALEYLAGTDFSKVEIGRHDLSDGLYAMVQTYETKSREEKQWEAHRKYIDVQFVASGAELIGYSDITELQPTTEYDTQGDCILLDGEGDFLRLSSGTFSILYPQDAHMPGVMAGVRGNVRKVVVKVPV